MADSDDDYVQNNSDDEADAHRVARETGKSARPAGAQGSRSGGWDLTRSWEDVKEGADGTINSTVEGLLEAGKRKRLLKDTTPLRRGIIRHLLLILDLSSSMSEKDLRPTRHLLTLSLTTHFITEYFDQNPISQLGLIAMHAGLALPISPISGSPSAHLSALARLRTSHPPQGLPSLQNALDMARGALFHAPRHTTREVVVVMGSLLSADPGDIHQSIRACAQDGIVCTVIGLAAQVAICRTLVERTNPSRPASQTYGVALNEQHFRELLMRNTTPPPTATATGAARQNGQGESKEEAGTTAGGAALLMMGFPSRVLSAEPTLCACHSTPTRRGYLCSRCGTKVCALPTACPACGLTLLLSTHLARSYHHLFPLRNWVEVSWARVRGVGKRGGRRYQAGCFGCLAVFPAVPERVRKRQGVERVGDAPVSATGWSESGRYECESCEYFFCIDCDVFAHEVVHNCPGCLSREGELAERDHHNTTKRVEG